MLGFWSKKHGFIDDCTASILQLQLSQCYAMFCSHLMWAYLPVIVHMLELIIQVCVLVYGVGESQSFPVGVNIYTSSY